MEPLRNAPPLFEVLTQQAANGDNRAFQQLYDLIAGRMYSLCLRYAGNSNDANDCFQEGFVKLYRHLSGFRGEGSFEGWARRIFVSTCIDFIKKKKAMFTVISDDFDIAADGLNGYDKLTNDDLMKTISTMPDGYRTVINLYLVEGYNHKEIGEMLDISEEGSRSQLFRARVYLQKLFKETHGGRSDILNRLREYEVQPPPEAFHNLLIRLEAGVDDYQWLGAWQDLQELEVSPPPYMVATIADAITGKPLFAALQEMTVTPPAGAFKRILREATAGEGKTPAPVRKVYLRYSAIAAVLLLVIAGWGIYRFNHRAPAHPSGELVRTTTPATVPDTAAVHPSTATPEATVIARYQEYDNVKTENYFRNNRFTADGTGMEMVENDFIVTFASYQYEQLPAFLTEEEDSEMMIRLDQYSHFTISENMMSSLKRMYQRRSRGTPTRRARKEKAKLEQWKKADEGWFDHKNSHNPLDPIDLAEFIFK